MLIPARVPDDWRVRCSYFAGAERPPSGPRVSINYRSDSAHEDLSIGESAASDPDPIHVADRSDWEHIDRGGHALLVRARGERFPESQVRVERDGTRVYMFSSSLARERMIELAAGLVAAPAR